MIQKTKQAWFEVWGNEVAQNQILKLFLLLFCGISVALAAGITILALRPPPIYAVSMLESGQLRSKPLSKEYLESESKRVITAYLKSRHNWESSSIRGSIGAASRFVDDSFRKSFLQANETQIRIAQEKKISQKFYVLRLDADVAKGTAIVMGDRILTVDGFRAVSAMNFNLTFRLGSRTEQNPEGVYITSEQLVETGKEPR